MTSDQTILIGNQNPDAVILVWEHTVCVGLGLIRGHFRMLPQPGRQEAIESLIFVISRFSTRNRLSFFKICWHDTFLDLKRPIKTKFSKRGCDYCHVGIVKVKKIQQFVASKESKASHDIFSNFFLNGVSS